ncbi:MAG: transposase [Tannerella sp.]|jgi:hypothetical protein|nr:transposase [Tannerella sp.]
MFRKSSASQQLEIFSTPTNILLEKSLRYYSDGHSWHNIFCKEVLMRIDEKIFSPLFCSNNGAPNAWVRLLVGMMMLKEGFDQIEFQINDRLSFMRFLNLTIADDIPDSRTVWHFREQITDLGLVEELFELFLKALNQLGLIINEGKIIDARWTRKNSVSYFGYKNHVREDEKSE